MLLKAAAGGGGKGMRRVDAESELESAIRDASSEAERAFQNGEVYIEKLIEKPRHIEIQIAGDRYGNLVHLGERECSVQRRHQKIIEECPSPLVAQTSGDAGGHGRSGAPKIARAAGYDNLGTVEFLADHHGNFYFLEVNTRLQVEHPVTELVTGYDLVQLQLRIAAGEALPFTQEDVAWRGWAMECRVCAEDPENQFLPLAGQDRCNCANPAGRAFGWTRASIRDGRCRWNTTHCWRSWWPGRPDRQRAPSSGCSAHSSEYAIAGVQTNIAFFREILEDPAVPARQPFHRVRRRFSGATKTAGGATAGTRRWRWRWPR